jgi:hypothetical protein
MMRIGVARVVFKNKNQAMFFSTVRFLSFAVSLYSWPTRHADGADGRWSSVVDAVTDHNRVL